MDKQEVVNETTVEQTTDVESTTTEPKTAEISEETPVDESIDTEKVSKSVPYERFKEVNEKVKTLEEMVAAMYQKAEPQVQTQVPDLDPEAAQAVDHRARQIYEQQEQQKFEAKHAKSFEKDPLLRAAFMVEVQNKMAKGEYIDRDASLESAKKALDERMNIKREEAKSEGVKEGQDIAKTKQQLGAVGETGKQPELDPDKLTPTEFAKYYNIPRAD